MVCSLLESIFFEPAAFDKKRDKSRTTTFIIQSFVFSYMWGIGGNVIETSRESFELFVSNQLQENKDARYFFTNQIFMYCKAKKTKNFIYICPRLPSSGELWNLYMNVQNQRLDLWMKLMPSPFIYDGNKPFFEILVPTIDTVRFGYIIEKMIIAMKPVFVTGSTGLQLIPRLR